MNVRVIDNSSLPLSRLLAAALTQAQEARFAVAFVSESGLSLVEESLRHVLEAGGAVEFVIALDGEATESGAVRLLYELSQSHDRASLYCYSRLGRSTALYHPKLYLVRRPETLACIIGSSNLTRPGLTRNLEVNVLIEGDDADEPVSDAFGAYARLKLDGRCFSPDDRMVGMYDDLWQRSQTRRARDPCARVFSEYVAGLPRPEPRRSDLTGWLGIVYDVLPLGEFTNADVYAHEHLFSVHYPANLNIRAKVRQKLQDLCRLGFIEHVEPGRWRRLR